MNLLFFFFGKKERRNFSFWLFPFFLQCFPDGCASILSNLFFQRFLHIKIKLIPCAHIKLNLFVITGEQFPHNSDYDLTEVEGKERLLALPGEKTTQGFPWASTVRFTQRPFRFNRLETIEHLFNVKDLLKQFDRDEEFVDTVFKVRH